MSPHGLVNIRLICYWKGRLIIETDVKLRDGHCSTWPILYIPGEDQHFNQSPPKQPVTGLYNESHRNEKIENMRPIFLRIILKLSGIEYLYYFLHLYRMFICYAFREKIKTHGRFSVDCSAVPVVDISCHFQGLARESITGSARCSPLYTADSDTGNLAV